MEKKNSTGEAPELKEVCSPDKEWFDWMHQNSHESWLKYCEHNNIPLDEDGHEIKEK